MRKKVLFVMLSDVYGGAEVSIARYLISPECQNQFQLHFIGSQKILNELSGVPFVETWSQPYILARSGPFRKIRNKVAFLLQSFYLSLLVPLIVHRRRLEVVYVNGSLSIVHFLFMLKASHVVWIGHIHDMVRGVSFRRLLAGTIEKFDLVVVPSKVAALEVTEYTGYPSDRIQVIPNGIVCDLQEIPSAGGGGRARSLGFAGAVIREKGVHLLVEAWKNLREKYPDLGLTIATLYKDNDYAQSIKNGLPEDLWSQIRFARLSNVEMAKFYKSIDIFVLPTLRESFSMVLLEAICSGCLVIASRVDGPAEILHPESLFEPCSAKAIEEKVGSYLNLSPSECLSIRQANIDLVKNRYSLETQIRRLNEVIGVAGL